MASSTDTKMQLRCTHQEKDLWLAVAGGEGKLSEWVREQLNAAATPKSEKTPHIPNLADGDVVRDSVSGDLFRVRAIKEALDAGEHQWPYPPPGQIGPEPEIEANGHPAAGVLEPVLDDAPPEPEDPWDASPLREAAAVMSLDSECVGAVNHWRLAQGEACQYCGGVA